MEASSTTAPLSPPFEMPAWKTMASHGAAAIIAILFFGAGVWKVTDPFGWAKKVETLLVPYDYSLPLAIALGIAETFAAILILVPRFRRWGAMLAGGLLLVFMAYIGFNYSALQGQDCTCFPDIHLPFGLTISMQRSVGPEFFYGDIAMLGIAALAGLWAKPSSGLRTVAVILGAVTVFSGISYGVAYTNLNSIKAPDSIEVEGQQVSLQEGRFFLFFFNPECGHCLAAATHMSHLRFKDDIQVIGIPTSKVQWDMHLFFTDEPVKWNLPKLSMDSEKLREVFVFEYPPYGVVIEDGRQAGLVPNFDEYNEEHPDPNAEPAATLRKLGVVE